MLLKYYAWNMLVIRMTISMMFVVYYIEQLLNDRKKTCKLNIDLE